MEYEEGSCYIMMFKYGNKLVFKILVWTNTGFVYCLYINYLLSLKFLTGSPGASTMHMKGWVMQGRL